MNKTTTDSMEQGNRIGKTLGDSIAEGIQKPGQGVEKELGLQNALEKVAGRLPVGDSSMSNKLNEGIEEALFLQSNKKKTSVPLVDSLKNLGEVVPSQGIIDKPKNEQAEIFRRLRGLGFSAKEALAELGGM